MLIRVWRGEYPRLAHGPEYMKNRALPCSGMALVVSAVVRHLMVEYNGDVLVLCVYRSTVTALAEFMRHIDDVMDMVMRRASTGADTHDNMAALSRFVSDDRVKTIRVSRGMTARAVVLVVHRRDSDATDVHGVWKDDAYTRNVAMTRASESLTVIADEVALSDSRHSWEHGASVPGLDRLASCFTRCDVCGRHGTLWHRDLYPEGYDL